MLKRINPIELKKVSTTTYSAMVKTKAFSFIIFIFLLITINTLNGQITISGYIVDEKAEPLPNINILVYPANSEIIVAFGISGSDGRFNITTKVPVDSLDVKTSSIHFEKAGTRIGNVNSDISFSLKPDVKQLETFTVRASPIEKRGDTLSYLVSSFNKSNDRSIEDVIKRMPGIEVEKDGKILYQGMPIQKFYVEGLDLMDGRYTVVSKNLDLNSVATVEIYENHQPVKVLEDKVTSQQASMNLKLKHNVTTTGTAHIGIGMSPLLWDVNLTPMTFTKTFQMVSSYQTNNTGKDVSNQIKRLTSEGIAKIADLPTEKPEYLSVYKSPSPDFEENRYLNNNIHLLNLNGLFKSGDNLQFRANLFYINDYQHYESTTYRRIYLANDTLSFSENIRNRNFSQTLHGELTLTRNVKASYLNNKLKFNADWGKQFGLLRNMDGIVDQRLNNPLQSLSNDLVIIHPFGEKLIKISSYISLDNNVSDLKVSPGSFENILNQSQPYDEAWQNLRLRRLFTDHSASLIFGIGGFSFTPQLGFSFRLQTLDSDLFTIMEGVESNPGIKFANDLDASRVKVYAQTGIEYKKSGFTFRANLPFSYQNYQLSDNERQVEMKSGKLFFDPGLSFYYKLKGYWRFSGSWSYYNRLGDPDQQYYGYILRNYLNLRQNAAPVSLSTGSRYSTSASYQNPINSLFGSVHYLFNAGLNNLIYKNQINQDGSMELQAIELPNRIRVHSIQAQTSKYYYRARLTTGLKVNFTLQEGKSYVNDDILTTHNQFLIIKPYLDSRILPWLNGEYSLTFRDLQSGLQGKGSFHRSLLVHGLNFYTLFRKNNQVSINTEYYSLGDNPFFFADLKYQYSLTKHKIDFKISWINILNAREYINYQPGSFTMYETIYKLRPSQLVVTMSFRF
ncbi:MAG: carboxypeptidase-like regulatory domain-containing protein [Lentimicrobium sp.]|nr:carboxypeptidase-like regulatory domain-containing protein [Lentimicrobium sp.]